MISEFRLDGDETVASVAGDLSDQTDFRRIVKCTVNPIEHDTGSFQKECGRFCACPEIP